LEVKKKIEEKKSVGRSTFITRFYCEQASSKRGKGYCLGERPIKGFTFQWKGKISGIGHK